MCPWCKSVLFSRLLPLETGPQRLRLLDTGTASRKPQCLFPRFCGWVGRVGLLSSRSQRSMSLRKSLAAVGAVWAAANVNKAAAFTPGSCKGLCGSFAQGRDCFCDGYCIEKGDCCDDFFDVCDDVSDHDDCLLHGVLQRTSRCFSAFRFICEAFLMPCHSSCELLSFPSLIALTSQAYILACQDNDACLLAAGGPPSCPAFAVMTPSSCEAHPTFAKCCASSCNLCKGRVQGATLARRLAGNGGGDGLCVDEGALVCPGACNGHGDCDYASGVCACHDGWGSEQDVAQYKAPDCSKRVR